jgi:hypothetical protein
MTTQTPPRPAPEQCKHGHTGHYKYAKKGPSRWAWYCTECARSTAREAARKRRGGRPSDRLGLLSIPGGLIDRYLRPYLVESNGDDFDGTSRNHAVETLCDSAKVSRRRVWQIQNRHDETVSFDTADKLFCAMGIPMIWYQDPDLNALYEVPHAA